MSQNRVVNEILQKTCTKIPKKYVMHYLQSNFFDMGGEICEMCNQEFTETKLAQIS